MRLPSLPIYVDEFPALRRPAWPPPSTVGIFVLSHFHTDHMKGLHSGWDAGIILTSTVTKQLLLNALDGLRGRVFALPYWCRTPLLVAAAQHHQERGVGACSTTDPASSSPVYVTLLPALHIPGSAMVFLEAPSGVTFLYTGDFKFTEAADRQSSLLRRFLQTHRVDHLFIDDTWLHLGRVEVTQWPPCDTARGVRQHGSTHLDSGCDASEIRVVSKLLSAEQVAEAIEAIGRRMDHQLELFVRSGRARAAAAASERCSGDGGTPSSTAHDGLPAARQPFVMRVYLHNQFGKEQLIQQLAKRLRTRAIIDDVRYTRLLTVVEALEEERDDLRDFDVVDLTNTVQGGSVDGIGGGLPPLSLEERAWRAAGGEAALYPYDLNSFVSASQARACLSASVAEGPANAGGVATSALIEVVSSRAAISPEALQQASQARNGTPYYGVVISGWARLQGQSSVAASASSSACTGGGQVWHIPTTLHSTPQEMINFVALLRPLSITPLHYRPSRAAVVLQRLGPYLRAPFVNQVDAGLADVAAPRWQLCLPTHVVGQNNTAATEGEPASKLVDVDGLDALVKSSRPGYCLRPPSETGVLDDFNLATAPSSLSSCPQHCCSVASNPRSIATSAAGVPTSCCSLSHVDASSPTACRPRRLRHACLSEQESGRRKRACAEPTAKVGCSASLSLVSLTVTSPTVATADGSKVGAPQPSESLLHGKARTLSDLADALL
jgi:hypothetical protein